MSRTSAVHSQKSRQKLLSALRAAARELGHTPIRSEFMRVSGIHYCKLTAHFPGFRAALRAAGLEPQPGGLRIDTAAMLKDWGRVARKLGRIPTRDEYTRLGRYASASLETRFHGWSRVRLSFLEFAEGAPGHEWTDVAASIRNGPLPQRGGGRSWLKRDRKVEKRSPASTTILAPPISQACSRSSCSLSSSSEAGGFAFARSGAPPLPSPLAGRKCVTAAMLVALLNAAAAGLPLAPPPPALVPVPWLRAARNLAPWGVWGGRAVFSGAVRGDRPAMGRPLLLPGLAHEPVNEVGVVFLFGMLAHRLGFLVESLQMGFPDCEAKREVEPGRWQRFRIEFEYESRKFRDHHHDPAGCDLIVCWKHNWRNCPSSLEVLELSAIV